VRFIESLAYCPRCSDSIKTFNERDSLCERCNALIAWQGSTPYLLEMADMSLPEFSCVVAVDLENGIGFNGDLPWPRIPADMGFFKRLTEGESNNNVVIMGRKTWESIPAKFRPLPKRNNIVLSKTLSLTSETFSTKLYFCRDGLTKALELAASLNAPETFVIGGGEIYKEAVNHPNCRQIFLTRIMEKFPADVFFPDIATLGFSNKNNEEEGVYKDIHYQIQRWTK